jgi:hypothetical protein
MTTYKRFNPLPGVDEEVRKEVWAQKIAGNLLLYEIFTTLESYGKPMRIKLLSDLIWSRHRLDWRRTYIQRLIRDLIYIDHMLENTKIGSGSYVSLTNDTKELVARAKRLHPGPPPPPIL